VSEKIAVRVLRCLCGKRGKYINGWCGACHYGYMMTLTYAERTRGIRWGFGEPPKENDR